MNLPIDEREVLAFNPFDGDFGTPGDRVLKDKQIDYATDILRATNDLLEARAEYRKAQEYGNIHKVIDAQVKVIKAELALKAMYPPDEDLSQPPAGEIVDSVTTDSTVPYDCGETFPRAKRATGMHPDDPRRGQSSDINRANRGNV